MGTFGDGKVLLWLLVCLAASSASRTEQPNAGYDYKTATPGGGLNRILKAVLVHESTGHGVHAGSVSGQNDGNRITVTKQGAHSAQSSGYSYSSGHQQRAMKNIRVFHKSLGDTGNIQPQGYGGHQAKAAEMTGGYPPQRSYNPDQKEFAGNRDSSPTANPSQSLRYIHEAALARPSVFLPTAVPPEVTKSGYNYGNAQRVYQPSNQGFQFAPQLGNQGGYQYQNPGQAFEALSSLSAQGYRSPGYSYPSPAPTQTSGGAEQIAISHYVSSAVQPANPGYRYDKPQQELSGVPQFIQAATSNGYQYPRPEPQERQVESVGYHYDRPEISFDYDKPAVTKSTFKGQSYLPVKSVGNKGYDSPQPAAQSNGYTYDRPSPSERPRAVFKGPSYLPLPPASGGW